MGIKRIELIYCDSCGKITENLYKCTLQSPFGEIHKKVLCKDCYDTLLSMMQVDEPVMESGLPVKEKTKPEPKVETEVEPKAENLSTGKYRAGKIYEMFVDGESFSTIAFRHGIQKQDVAEAIAKLVEVGEISLDEMSRSRYGSAFALCKKSANRKQFEQAGIDESTQKYVELIWAKVPPMEPVVPVVEQKPEVDIKRSYIPKDPARARAYGSKRRKQYDSRKTVEEQMELLFAPVGSKKLDHKLVEFGKLYLAGCSRKDMASALKVTAENVARMVGLVNEALREDLKFDLRELRERYEAEKKDELRRKQPSRVNVGKGISADCFVVNWD